jgi:uncharacterized protein YgbK (DUF1537 family)
MIIVIADDITGAAEMGGIALRYDQKVIVSDDLNKNEETDVLVIYTNTRSMQKHQAVEVMRAITAKAYQLKPELFYKKTDSVLRGHVLAEIKAQMMALHLEKALLVPVNPSLGRVIKGGQYFLNGQLIHETSFSSDPEFPILSSQIEKMLGEKDGPLQVVSKNDLPLPAGISVGEAATDGEIAEWAKANNGNMLLAGGASFFNALLAEKFGPHPKVKKQQAPLSSPQVFVSGTNYRRNVKRIEAHSSIVSYMPAHIFSAAAEETIRYDEWMDKAMQILEREQKVIIAIDNRQNKKGDPMQLRERLGELVNLLFEKLDIGELLIEGGSVAYSIIQKLGWKSFIPTEELGQGIVRMQVPAVKDVHLTIKPGSYEWPSQWGFN